MNASVNLAWCQNERENGSRKMFWKSDQFWCQLRSVYLLLDMYIKVCLGRLAHVNYASSDENVIPASPHSSCLDEYHNLSHHVLGT